MPKTRHIAEVYLKHVGIKFTRNFFSGTMENNPFPDTFAGIHEILASFNIQSSGIALSQDELLKLKDPFITLLSGQSLGFIVVTEISDDGFWFLTEENQLSKLDNEDFFAKWDGKILFPEVGEHSDESDYYRNVILSTGDQLKIPVTTGLVLALIVFLLLKNHQGHNLLFTSITLILYCSGIAVSILLLMESMNIYNPLIRKICNASPQTNCSAVLASKGAKLFGIIGWSEIGFIYFAGNLLYFLLFPNSAGILFLINILSLPYSIWSVIYQKYITRKWCPLCITVQILFWIQFAIFIISGTKLQFNNITPPTLLYYLACLVVPAVSLSWIVPLIKQSREGIYFKRSLIRLKSDEAVFNALLERGNVCDLPQSARCIILGNTEAENTITVISNPYCGYCASFHARLIKFLRLHRQFKAELVFVGEVPAGEIIKSLISIYFTYGSDSAEQIYAEWFESYEKIFKKYEPGVETAGIADIYQTTNKWYNENGRMGTPSVFINNRLMPESYVLEDLAYLF